MYQIAFENDQFPTLAPFLMMNRMGLTILLHPESGRPRDDHTINAVWMGQVLPLITRSCPRSAGPLDMAWCARIIGRPRGNDNVRARRLL